jgi:ubiquinone/menaquinone biosynthesis C-methylase UbiE
MEIGMGFMPSKVLLTAVELRLFTKLAREPGDLHSLQARLGLHPRSARDFLDTLVSLGLLERDGGIYRNTADTDLFLDAAKPSYVGGILEMAGARLFGFWNHFTTALSTGELQNEAKHGGDSVFAAIYADPERLQGFLRAMTGISHGANMCIARKFPWADYESYVDVGTAQGDLAVQIAKANPHLSGTGFDLESVGPIFRQYVAEQAVSDRVSFLAGDFFKDPLPKADVVLMGHILHDWGLADKRRLLRRAYDALPAGGAVVAYDAIIDDDRRRNSFGLLVSLNMLIETEAGFDYTGADCMSWMKEAGFRNSHVEHLVGPDSMVVGIK